MTTIDLKRDEKLKDLISEVREEIIGLSHRELQILGHIAQGKTFKSIASELGLACGTVKNESMNLYRKLDAFNNAHAVAIGKDLGII